MKKKGEWRGEQLSLFVFWAPSRVKAKSLSCQSVAVFALGSWNCSTKWGGANCCCCMMGHFFSGNTYAIKLFPRICSTHTHSILDGKTQVN